MGQNISSKQVKDMKEAIYQQYQTLQIESERMATIFIKASKDANQLSSRYYKPSSDQYIDSLYIKEEDGSPASAEDEKEYRERLLEYFEEKWALHVLNLLKETRMNLTNQPKRRNTGYSFKYIPGNANDIVLFKYYVSNGGQPKSNLTLYCYSIERFDLDMLRPGLRLTLEALIARESKNLRPIFYEEKQSGLLTEVLNSSQNMSKEEFEKYAEKEGIMVNLFKSNKK